MLELTVQHFLIHLQLPILRNQRNVQQGNDSRSSINNFGSSSSHNNLPRSSSFPADWHMANKPQCHAVRQTTQVLLCLKSRPDVSHILPGLRWFEAHSRWSCKYVSSKLKQSSDSSLCFQKTVHFWFWKSLEFGRWMFI